MRFLLRQILLSHRFHPFMLQKLRCSRPPLGHLLKTPQQKINTLRRTIDRQGRMLVLHNPYQRRQWPQIRIGRISSHQLNDSTPQRPNIALSTHSISTISSLRRHPVRRPPRRQSLLIIGHIDSHTKIRYLYPTLLCYQNVQALNIAVRDVQPVQVVQTLQDLVSVQFDQSLGKDRSLT